MEDFNKLLWDIHAWHKQVFGKPCDPKRTAIKLLEESAEAYNAIRNGTPGTSFNELADVALVLFSILTAFNPVNIEFEHAIRAKMKIVEDRNQIERDKERGI